MPKRPSRIPRVYCIVPQDLAAALYEPLREHFAGDARVEVIVEQRWRDRRRVEERRVGQTGRTEENRRRIRSKTGRRTGDRRAPTAVVDWAGALPRRARAHVGRLVFVERLAPTGQQAEEHDSLRLVARFQAGDRSAFGELYLRYFDRVYSYLRFLLRDAHDAEEGTQVVFVKIFEALGRYERRRSAFSAWLFTIVRNHALDELKRRRRTDVTDPIQFPERDEAAGEDGEGETLPALGWIADRELLMFVERLPEAQRQVLLLRYMLELSTREIAEVLEREEDDIRMLHSRALRFLRARLAAIGRSERGRRIPMRSPLRAARVVRNRRFALTR